MKNKIRVLVADSNKEFCTKLKENLQLNEFIEIAGIVHNGKEAYEAVLEKRPDLTCSLPIS